MAVATVGVSKRGVVGGKGGVGKVFGVERGGLAVFDVGRGDWVVDDVVDVVVEGKMKEELPICKDVSFRIHLMSQNQMYIVLDCISLNHTK